MHAIHDNYNPKLCIYKRYNKDTQVIHKILTKLDNLTNCGEDLLPETTMKHRLK